MTKDRTKLAFSSIGHVNNLTSHVYVCRYCGTVWLWTNGMCSEDKCHQWMEEVFCTGGRNVGSGLQYSHSWACPSVRLIMLGVAPSLPWHNLAHQSPQYVICLTSSDKWQVHSHLEFCEDNSMTAAAFKTNLPWINW